MTPKQYLQQAYRLNELIDSDLAELSTLRSLSTSVSSVSLEQERVSGGNQPGSKIENIVVKIVDLENEINAEIDQYIDLKAAIRKAINEVENRNEQLILRLRYVEFLQWPDIQQRMAFEERQVFNIHRNALKNFKIPQTMQFIAL